MFNPDIRLWHSHSATYTGPLPWRHVLKLFGYYIGSRPDALAHLSTKGKSWQTSMRYSIPFMMSNGFRHTITFGFDFKRANNFADYDVQNLRRVHVDVDQFSLEYQGMFEDSYGLTSGGFNFFLSPGHMSAFNDTFHYNEERTGAHCSYVYATLDLDRVTRFAKGFAWVLSANAQISGTKLIPSEQLSVGGYYSVRGYKENYIIGDFGWVIRNEIITPDFSILNKKSIKDRCQFLAFIDYGKADQIDENLPPDRIRSYMASVGPGRFSSI